MSWAKDFHFTVEPVQKTDVFAPTGGWNKAVPPVSPWTVGAASSKIEVQAYQSDENLKKLFGIELAKTTNPFEAGCKVFGEETNKALWVSFNWMTDPIVLSARDVYLKNLELSQPPLDREQLAAKVLALAEETYVTQAGVKRPSIEAKDRISAFKLYSEIMGYTGKVEIDNSTKTINTNNELKIILVKAEDKKPVVLENAPNVKSEILNEKMPTPINLKLVKAS